MPSKNVSLFEKEAFRPYREQDETSVVVRIGVIGCGYWGPNLIRNFHELPSSKVVAICDLQEERLKPFVKKFPGAKLTAHYQDILNDPTIDAVVVATPISTHFRISCAAVKAGKHVLVEKPLTATTKEGMALIHLARRRKKMLMVGHTFEYNPAVLKIAQLLQANEVGSIHYLDSVRVNLGLHQSDDRNVIWDLAPHDLSIILRWVQGTPNRVSAWGRPFIKKDVEDVAFIRLDFPGGILAHLHVSWLAPSKIRRITVVGSKKMIVYDDLESVEKIKIADQGAHWDPSNTELKVNYRMGDIVSPRVDIKEPLSQECAHFIDCILQNKNPQTDGERGLEVVRILEAADKSIKKGGVAVSL
jgi:predicted dehydrogenase